MTEKISPFQGLDTLVLFRKIASLPFVTAFRRVWRLAASAVGDKQELLREYCALTEEMLERLDRLPWAFRGEGWTALLVYTLLHQENLYSLRAEKSPASCGPRGESAKAAAAQTDKARGTAAQTGESLPAGGPLPADKLLPAELTALAERELHALSRAASLCQRDLAALVARRLGTAPEGLPSWNMPGLFVRKPAPPEGKREAWDFFLSTDAWGQGCGLLTAYYRQNGAGPLGAHLAFRWRRPAERAVAGNEPRPGEPHSGTPYPEEPRRGELPAYLTPVTNRDPIRFSQLIGYADEHQKLIQNTRQFLAGLPANNVLLYGDRGTGKSSAVKALINKFGGRGLRLVEMTKDQLPDLPFLLEILEERGLKFILFVDDLSFSELDGRYASLKALLEGGAGIRPDNVLIYATSNRRHLLPEKFSDRSPMDAEDLRMGDTVQEKLSLADRFGMTLTFLSPDQKGYLHIVEELAEARKLPIGKESLRRRALEWEMWQNLRSPRTARQFVDHLTGELLLAARDEQLLIPTIQLS